MSTFPNHSSIAQKSPNKPILRLRKSLIRPFNENDALALAKEANNPEIARWMRNTFPHPYRIEDAIYWIKSALSASPMLNFAICRLPDDDDDDDNQNHNYNNETDEGNEGKNDKEISTAVIGGIGLRPFDDIYHRTMQIGYWLGEQHWGQGIITEAIKCFSEWTFEQDQFAHVVRLEVEVFEGNDASMKVSERAGFIFEGQSRNAIEKNGVVMGLLRYVRFREGW